MNAAELEGVVRSVRNEYFEAIEFARDEVTEADLPALVEAYWQLTSWFQRSAMVQLIADYRDPRLHALMLDFLGAPEITKDVILVAKASAICVLLGNYDRYKELSGNPERAEAEARALRTQHGCAAAPSLPLTAIECR